MENNIIKKHFEELNLNFEEIGKQIEELKKTNYSITYKENNLCDININNSWTVGAISKINDKKIIVYEYLLTNEKRSISKIDKNHLTYFRKKTKPNKKKRQCERQDEKTLKRYNEFFENFIKYNFGNESEKQSMFKNLSPSDYLIILRGKLYYVTDEVLCFSYENDNIGIDLSLKYIENLLMIIKLFFDYTIQNNEIIFLFNLFKNTNYEDIVLINEKFAIISFLKDSLTLLKRIFGHSYFFVDFYYQYENEIRRIIENDKSILTSKEKIEKICHEKAYEKKIYFKIEKLEIPLRPIAYAIDYFYSIDGFNSLTNLIISNDKFSFLFIKQLTSPFVYISSVVGKFTKKLNDNIESLREYIDKRILNFSVEEINKNDKEDILIVINRIYDFLNIENNEKQKKFENTYLNYLYKCFSSNILEKQLYAIESFDSIVLTIKYNYSKNENEVKNIMKFKNPYIKLLNEEEFTLFLSKNQIINSLLQETTNEELIKNSYNIISISYKNNFGLNKDDYSDIINEKAKNIFQSLYKRMLICNNNNQLQLIIQNLFCKLAPILNKEHKLLIFQFLKEYISNQEINKDLIKLLEKYTYQCLFENENKDIFNLNLDEINCFGLKMLWSYMQNETQKKIHNQISFFEIVDTCINSIKKILNIKNLSDSVREDIIIISLEKISDNEGSEQNLILIKELIVTESLFNNYNLILEKINQNSNLFIVIISHLLYFLETLYQNNNNKGILSEEKKSKDEQNLSYINLYTNEEIIKIHLNLIIELMNKKRNLNWEFDKFFDLWKFASKDIYLSNLFYNSFAGEFQNIKDIFKEEFFEKILNNNKLFPIKTNENFELYKKFFYGINSNNDTFILFYNDLKIFTNDLNSIIGYETLWETLINNNDFEIQKNISDLLYKIAFAYKFPKKKEAKDYYTSFIQTLISNLNKIIEKDEFQIKGILYLIKEIFENQIKDDSIIENELQLPSIIHEKNKNEDQNFLTIYFHYIGLKASLIIYNYYPLYYVRYKISLLFGIHPNHIKFQFEYFENKTKKLKEFDLCDDFEIFNQIVFENINVNFEKFYDIKVIKSHNPLIDLEDNPKSILIKNEDFEKILLKLLKNEKNPYLKEIWNILKEKIGENNYIKDCIIKIINNNDNKLNNEIDITFDFFNSSIYYISYLISNIKQILNNNKNTGNNKFIIDFLNSKIYIGKFDCFIQKYQMNKYFDSQNESFFSEKNEFLTILNNLIEILEIFSQINNEDRNNLIKDKIIQFIPETFEIGIEDCNLNEIIYNQKIEVMEKIINLIQKDNSLIFNYVFKLLKDNKKKDNLLFQINENIIKNKNKKVKKEIKEFIFIILNYSLYNNEEQKNLFREINYFLLINLLNDKNFSGIYNLANESKCDFDLYFEIINKIILNSLELKLDFNFETFLKEQLLKTLLKERNLSQSLISGYFLLSLTIVQKLKISYLNNISSDSFDLIKFIFEDLLFNQTKKNRTINIKLKSKKAFKFATNLLNYLLIENPEKLNIYYKLLFEYHNTFFFDNNLNNNWNIIPKDISKKNFVGLKNLGCTCYLNTLIQILYNIIPFRESILKCDCKKEVKNVLFQIKKIFYYLKYYNIEFIAPIDFVQNFDNEQLNVNVQMDIDEFFNILLDKIENHLKGTDNENLIKYFFEGKITDNLIFQKGCTHHKKKEVSFYSILLQIKGKKNLKESLDSFIEGELMDNENSIYCDFCQNKFPVIKSQSFNKLPRILMFVLKRFEFDNQSLQKIKINDEYEFPLELDMSDYMYNNLKKNNLDDKDNTQIINDNDTIEKMKDSEELKNDDEDNMHRNEELKYKEDIFTKIDEKMNDENNNKIEEKNENNKNEENIKDGNIFQISNDYKEVYLNQHEENETNYKNHEIYNNNNNENIHNYKYKLKAIAIHMGNSEAGHYYSFIRVGDSFNEKWYEFNDIKISEIDVNNLSKESFGGYDTFIDPDTNKVESFPSNRNAYLLFYEKEKEENYQYDKIKVIKEPENLMSEEIPLDNEINKTLYLNSLQKLIFNPFYQRFILEFIINLFNQFFQKNVLNKLINFSCRNKECEELENNLNEIRLNKFDSSLNYYLQLGKITLFKNENYNLKYEENKEKFLDYFKFLITYFFNIYIRSNEKYCLGGIIELIKFCLNYNPFCSSYFIEEFMNINILTEYLVNCPIIEMKKIFVGLIFCAMINVNQSYIPQIKSLKEEREIIENERKKNLEMYLKEKKEDKEDKEDNSNLINVYNDNDDEILLSFDDFILNQEKENSTYQKPFKEILEFSPLLSFFIKNIIRLIQMLQMNEKGSNFLFYIIFRFTLISSETRNYLINNLKLLLFLNFYFFPDIFKKHPIQKFPLQTTWDYLIPNHKILSTVLKDNIEFNFDEKYQIKENYVAFILFQLNLSQKELNKNYIEDYSFKNENYILSLFKNIKSKQGAHIFGNLLCKLCFKNEEITLNVIKVIKEIFNGKSMKIHSEFFLILQIFLIDLKDTEDLIDLRIHKIIKKIFKTINKKIDDLNIALILGDFLIYLFHNFNSQLKKYIDLYINNFKNLLDFYSENEEIFFEKIKDVKNIIKSKIIFYIL